MKKHSLLWLLMILLISCGKKESKFKKQEIDVIESETADESADSVDIIAFSKTLNQLKTKPGTVLQTGFPAHRLTPVYLAREIKDKRFYEKEDTIKKYDFSLGETDYNTYDYVMPGFDLLKGYYMLNISHFNMNTQQQNWMFAKPVLINSIYYPSLEPDSVNKKPMLRNYYLVSVYENDTNKDTVLNSRDLRRLYYVNLDVTEKRSLLPENYSVYRSSYDEANDMMLIYARKDSDRNGSVNSQEPTHTFYLDLKNPVQAIPMYQFP